MKLPSALRIALLTCMIGTFGFSSAPAQSIPPEGTHVVTVSAFEFHPLTDNVTGMTPSGYYYRTFSVPNYSSGVILAPVHLPDGAVVIGAEMEYCRANGSIEANLHEECLDGTRSPCFSAAPGDEFGTAGDPGSCGRYYAPQFARFPAENAVKQYFIIASVYCADSCPSFRAVRLFYNMSAAPAPALAHFSDVSTAHPFFRFVEALYSTGAIAGCGNGKYCPDAPVTRGQLAVIIGEAFGLGW